MEKGRRKVLFASLLAGALVSWAPACHTPEAGPRQRVAEHSATTKVSSVAADSSFARLVARLSEPGGYFDTDNLISNESSYLHVLGALERRGLRGGAYLGVGPDQNFSYIARIRPNLAFLIDIRRDNLLQHIFFKALFARARTRIEYLCLLFGKPFPPDGARWKDADLRTLIGYIDAAPVQAEHAEAARARVQEAARHAGLPLSEADQAIIGTIHSAFLRNGLDLQFTSHGRPARFYYPTYRDLLLEKDLTGAYGSYLAREDDYQFLKTLQAQDRLVPVVGDLSGPHALAAIGDYLDEVGEAVSAFYTSNVEFYLMRQGRFDRFVENVTRLPLTDRSVIIRSYFNRFSSSHPQSVPGYTSTQLLQTLESLVEEHERSGYRTYWDLVNRHSLDLR